MKKLIAVCAISGSIAFLTGACAEQPAEPPRRAAVFKPLFGASAAFNNAGQCLGNDAVTWGQLAGLQGITRPSDLNCTSSDVRVATVDPTEISLDGGETWIPFGSSPISCSVGQIITLRMTATLQSSTTSGRLDVGLWVATDGGDALDGSCNQYDLPVNPLLPGTSDLEGDSCGDLIDASSTTVDLGEVTTLCQAGPSGQVEIGMCTTFSLPPAGRACPVATLSGPDGFRAGTLPGGPARCGCSPVAIPNVAPAQTGSVTIIKDAVPDDPQDFSFTMSSGADASSFDLDDDPDAEPTLPKSRMFSGLAAGTYTVTEAATPGFDLTGVSCTTGGSGNVGTRTATINLTGGANVTCTFQNAKRATVQLNKRENGVLPLARAWGFEIRVNASTSAAGTVIASGAANLSTGVVNFACTPNPNGLCENAGGIANLVPTTYQLCEVGMPAGYTNNITSPPGFTPSGSAAEGSANAVECMNIMLAKADAGVPAGVPNPINNTAPPPAGGSIALGTGTFTLANNTLSGSFPIRNSSMGSLQVLVGGLTIVKATSKDGPNVVAVNVTGCTFTPLPVLIPSGASQTITLTGCSVAPPVRKDLTFTVRATITGGDQPFYDRTYKVRAQ